MACKLVPSSITTEGIINTTAIVGHITTIWTAAGILEEMTEAVAVAAAVAAAVVGVGVVATAAAEAVVNLAHEIEDTHRFCITIMLHTSTLGEEAPSRPEQNHSLFEPWDSNLSHSEFLPCLDFLCK